MRRARSPELPRAAWGGSSRRKAARCSSTRSATCRSTHRPGSCACFRRASSRPSAAACRSVPMSGSSPTHNDLRQLIRQGLFREDLYYRVNVAPIRLPPLRERTADIPALVKHFWGLAVREGLPMKRLDEAAMERLRSYRWPGNVRELENLVRRLAALYSQEVIGVDVIEAELADTPMTTDPLEMAGTEGLAGAVERHIKDYFAAHKGGLPAAGLYDRVLREVERPLIVQTLGATRGNQIRAAHLLGLNRNTLRKKIRELDIPVVRGIK